MSQLAQLRNVIWSFLTSMAFVVALDLAACQKNGMLLCDCAKCRSIYKSILASSIKHLCTFPNDINGYMVELWSASPTQRWVRFLWLNIVRCGRHQNVLPFFYVWNNTVFKQEDSSGFLHQTQPHLLNHYVQILFWTLIYEMVSEGTIYFLFRATHIRRDIISFPKLEEAWVPGITESPFFTLGISQTQPEYLLAPNRAVMQAFATCYNGLRSWRKSKSAASLHRSENIIFVVNKGCKAVGNAKMPLGCGWSRFFSVEDTVIHSYTDTAGPCRYLLYSDQLSIIVASLFLYLSNHWWHPGKR